MNPEEKQKIIESILLKMREDNRVVTEHSIQQALEKAGGIEFSYTGELFPIDFIEDYISLAINKAEKLYDKEANRALKESMLELKEIIGLLPERIRERAAGFIVDVIDKAKQEGSQETKQGVLDLLKLKCVCRIRGLRTDIQNGYKYESGLHEYEELLRHLEKLEYIIADIECAERHLTDEEKKRFKELKKRHGLT